MSTWSYSIPQIQPGDPVNAASVNNLVNYLAQREQYLKDQLDNYSDKTLILSYNQPVWVTTAGLLPGTPLYFNNIAGTSILYPAICGYAQSTNPGHLVPNDSAFVFGISADIYSSIVGSPSPQYGDVYVYGLVTGIAFAQLMDVGSNTGNEPPPGPLYLSTLTPGMYSTVPTGASVFIGYIIANHAGSPPTSDIFLSPNVDSLNQLYFNYQIQLNTATTGTQANPITSVSPAIQQYGWMAAATAAAYYGITVPTAGSNTAQFYYVTPAAAYMTVDNGFTPSQIDNVLKFKAAMPPYPGAYTQLFVNGILQSQATDDYPNGTYIVNEDGLWWMSDESGYLPYSPDSVNMQLLVTKLNPSYADSIVTSLTSGSSAITITDAASGETASTGNLVVGLSPTFSTSSGGNTGSGVQTVSYDSTSQTFALITAPVINAITPGAGITAVTTSGNTLVSLTSALSGEVTDIEPEEADYVYKGLHSYLRLRKPVINQNIGFVGKLLLPQVIPTGANFNIQLMAFPDGAAFSESYAAFTFSYVVSSVGGTLGTSITIVPGITVPSTAFSGMNVVSLISNSSFQIPNSALSPGSYVNFRIARNNAFSGVGTPVGVLGVLWTLA